MQSSSGGVTFPSQRAHRVRVVALRVVASVCGLFAALCVVLLASIPIALRWPDGPITIHGDLIWWYTPYLALLAFASARTCWLLWRRRRAGGALGIAMWAAVILTDYYGPLKGTQSVGLAIAMLALLAVGWRSLE